MRGGGPRVERLTVQVYAVPTPSPESDGTIEWDRTTMVLVEIFAGGRQGLGWSYASRATAAVIRDSLVDLVRGTDVFAIEKTWQRMIGACRNIGRPGAAMMAISAIDIALWDLKARLLDLSLVALLGAARGSVLLYGSGGFTSYDQRQLEEELGGYAAAGLEAVKMKVGRDRAADPRRVSWARAAIGDEVQLFVDANGGYTRRQADLFARDCAEWHVRWLEEPVSSDDLVGLRWLRDRVPPGMEIAAGEYGFDPWYFKAMLAAEAVDVLQVDATRCGGVTGFLRASALADGYQIAVSSHCAPHLHAHLGCAASRFAHAEYFRDHVRIEGLLFDGIPTPTRGRLAPDLAAPGMGLVLKRKEAARYEG